MIDTERNESNSKKTIFAFVVLLVIGAIVVLGVLIYNSLFPKEYWLDRELEQNQAKWESLHITNYQMSLDLPFLDYKNERMPIVVEVMNNKVISVVDAQEQRLPVNDPEIYSVSWLFSYAHQKITEKIYLINITYDPALDYPKVISITFKEPCCEEPLILSVKDFKILQP